MVFIWEAMKLSIYATEQVADFMVDFQNNGLIENSSDHKKEVFYLSIKTNS